MDKVLVTGANGHLGFHIVAELVRRGYRVRASVRDLSDARKTARLADLGVEIAQADLLDKSSLVRAMQGCDGLFQVAAGYKMHTDDMIRDVQRPALEGTSNVLRAAHEAGVKKVIYTSSVAAVGVSQDGAPRDEGQWNDHAQEFYARCKNDAEKLAWKLAQELSLNLIAVLPGTIIGPGFSEHTPSTFLFHKIAHNKLPAMVEASFSYVDVRDLATAHVTAYERPSANGRYIITNQTIDSKGVYAVAHAAFKRIKIPALHIPRILVPLLPVFDWLESRFTGSMRLMTRGSVREYLSGAQQRFDTAKATRDLAWAPRPIEESIRDTLQWIYEH